MNKLRIGEADEAREGELVGNLNKGELALQAADFEIEVLHFEFFLKGNKRVFGRGCREGPYDTSLARRARAQKADIALFSADFELISAASRIFFDKSVPAGIAFAGRGVY